MILSWWRMVNFDLELVSDQIHKKKMKKQIEIKVRGKLDETWTEWFEGLEITGDGQYSILSGNKKDDAFVHGILNKIRDLNLELISVNTND